MFLFHSPDFSSFSVGHFFFQQPIVSFQVAMEAGKLKKMSAYVFQDDVILGTMTVREAITMSAKLRLPADMAEAEKLQKVCGSSVELCRCDDICVCRWKTRFDFCICRTVRTL